MSASRSLVTDNSLPDANDLKGIVGHDRRLHEQYNRLLYKILKVSLSYFYTPNSLLFDITPYSFVTL